MVKVTFLKADYLIFGRDINEQIFHMPCCILKSGDVLSKLCQVTDIMLVTVMCVLSRKLFIT